MYPIHASKYENIKKFIKTQKDESEDILIVGMQGIQGCGKSYTCRQLRLDFEAQGMRTIVLSLDNFYYDRARMKDEIRGHPGTHDIDSLCAVIDSIKRQETCRIPIYDKYANNGKGDRKGYELIEIDSNTNVQIVLIEGWCIGFSPHESIEAQFVELNRHVKYYEDSLTSRLDAIVVLVANFQNSFQWRLRAEQNAKQKGEAGMSDEEIRTFVAHYIPVYELYVKKLQLSHTIKVPMCKIYCGEN